MDVKHIKFLAHVAVIAFIITALSPLLLAILFDLTATNATSVEGPYVDIVQSTRWYFITVIIKSSLLTLFITLSALTLTMIMGTLMSFALHYFKFRGRRTIWIMLLMLVMLPTRFYYIELAEIFAHFNITHAATVQIAIFTAQSLPMVVILMFLQMRAQPRHVMEWHSLHQKGPLGVLVHGLLPEIKAGIVSVAMVALIPMWNDLWVPMLFFSDDGLFAPAVLNLLKNATWFREHSYQVILPALVPSLVLYGLFLWSFNAQFKHAQQLKEQT